MSRVMRSVRNVTKGYSSTQIKVREATSNDPWGPTGTQMSEIAQMTFNTSSDFYDIMDMLDKRLNDKGKNWRHVLKALKVLDYCLHEGSELVVSWARQSIYIIKTLREFQYVDEEGRDVGQNVRIAAKEITSLILDEERLRAERSDRKSWKSRVTGLEEFPPPGMEDSATGPSRDRRGQRERRPNNEEEDAEYKLALEASKYQEEEDRKKREGRTQVGDVDDDLAKAIKLSKEEEEYRRRELEASNAASLFDDSPAQAAQPSYTGFNGGYQQGNQVDWFANPVDQNQSQNQMQTQPTGFMSNAYTGYQQPQATGFQNTFSTPFGTQPTGANPYGQQQQQGFQPQPTGYNPYGQQPQALQKQPTMLQSPVDGPGPSAGTNNPWATNSSSNDHAAAMKPTPTGSNNPFAQFNRPSSAQPTMNSLGAVPEQKTLASFQSQPGQLQQQPSFGQQQQQQQQPSFNNPQQKELNEHESKLNSLLATGDGMDTYGNTGQMRIPAQHTAPGTFVNSAGSGINRLQAEQTGNNPFLRQQFTGMPSVSYGNQPHPPVPALPAGMNGQGTNNPFGQQQQPGQQQNQDLIQF
ncbi:ENTH domain-containing protein [Emericellopsis atlantica]|uniref:ENTH domain-containing protein n=1 Tax=Emericellopsis atlantica TaxID=2614577 RepID=A0A9P7ZG23_9HYPO|nr:ENTH domain-containing protein [Emericellopsis atlantica]KAG9251320.1 ENTH domain-containing protein [Emericellopsis atlantica]